MAKSTKALLTGRTVRSGLGAAPKIHNLEHIQSEIAQIVVDRL